MEVIKRFFWILLWMIVLFSFSFGDLVLNIFDPESISLENKIMELYTSGSMILTTFGLIIMLHIDRYFLSAINRQTAITQYVDKIFSVNICLAVVMLLTALQRVKGGNMLIPELKLCYLLGLLIILLSIYKVQTSIIVSSKGNNQIKK